MSTRINLGAQNSRKAKDKLLELLERDKEQEKPKGAQQSYMDPLMELQRRYKNDAEAGNSALANAATGQQKPTGWQPRNKVPLTRAERPEKLPNKMSRADRIMMSKMPGAPGQEDEFRLRQTNDREMNALAAEKTKRNGAAVRPGTQIVGISRADERNVPLKYVDEKTTGWLDRPWYYVPVDDNGEPQRNGDYLVLRNDGADMASRAATADWWRRHGQPPIENGSKAWARPETIDKNLLRYGRDTQARQTGEEGYNEAQALEWYLGTEQGKRDAQQAGGEDAVRGAYQTNSTYRNGIVNQWTQSKTAEAKAEASKGYWREGIRADVERESMNLIHEVEDQMDPEDVNLYCYIMDGYNRDSAYDPEQTLAGIDEDKRDDFIVSFIQSFQEDMIDVLEAKGYEPQNAMTGTNQAAKEAARAEGERADLVRSENWKGYSIQLMDDIINMAESGKPTDALMSWNQAMQDNQRRLEELYGLKASGSNAYTGYWADDRNARDDVQNQIDILENEQEILVLGSVALNPDFGQRSQPIEEYANRSSTYALIAGMERNQFATEGEEDEWSNWTVTKGGVNADTIRNYMSERQKGTYLYLYNSPEYGPEKAGEYLEAVGRSLQYMQWQDKEAQERQWAKEHPGLAFAQDILTLPAQGLESAIYNISNLFSSKSPYDEKLFLTKSKETHRATTDEMFGDFVGRGLVDWWENYVNAYIGARQIPGFAVAGSPYHMSDEEKNWLYGVGKTAAVKSKNAVEQGLDSAYLMLLSYGISGAAAWSMNKLGLTAEALGVSPARLQSFLTSVAIQGTVLTQASTAAALTTSHAKEEGASDTVSAIKGLSSGFAEWLTETIGAEWMFKSNFVSQTLLNSGHYMAGLMFLSSAAEAMEEVFSLGLDTSVEAVLNGDRSEWEARRRAYENEHPGCSPMEATMGAGVSLAADALEQAASVFFTTGPSTAAFSAGYRGRANRATANQVQQLVNQGLLTQEEQSTAAATMQRGMEVQQRMEQAADNGLTYTPTPQDIVALQAMENLQRDVNGRASDEMADQAFASMVMDGMGVDTSTFNPEDQNAQGAQLGWLPAAEEQAQAVPEEQGTQTEEEGSNITPEDGVAFVNAMQSRGYTFATVDTSIDGLAAIRDEDGDVVDQLQDMFGNLVRDENGSVIVMDAYGKRYGDAEAIVERTQTIDWWVPLETQDGQAMLDDTGNPLYIRMNANGEARDYNGAFIVMDVNGNRMPAIEQMLQNGETTVMNSEETEQAMPEGRREGLPIDRDVEAFNAQMAEAETQPEAEQAARTQEQYTDLEQQRQRVEARLSEITQQINDRMQLVQQMNNTISNAVDEAAMQAAAEVSAETQREIYQLEQEKNDLERQQADLERQRQELEQQAAGQARQAVTDTQAQTGEAAAQAMTEQIRQQTETGAENAAQTAAQEGSLRQQAEARLNELADEIAQQTRLMEQKREEAQTARDEAARQAAQNEAEKAELSIALLEDQVENIRRQLGRQTQGQAQQAVENAQEATENEAEKGAAEQLQQTAEDIGETAAEEAAEPLARETGARFTQQEVRDIFRMMNGLKTDREYSEEEADKLMEKWMGHVSKQGHKVLEARGVLDGQSVRVVGLESVGRDAQVTVEEDGQRTRAALDEVEFDNPMQRAVYNFARGFKDLTAARLVLGAWEKSTLPFDIFRNAFSNVYMSARTGVALDQAQRLGASMLDRALVDRIKYLGHQAMQAESEEFLGSNQTELDNYLTQIRHRDTETRGYRGAVLGRTVHLENLSADQKVNIQALDYLGQKMGMRIVIVPHIQTPQERTRVEDADNRTVPYSGTVNGLFEVGTNTIVVALDSLKGAIVHHAGHESWHWVKDQARRQGGRIAQEVRAFGEDVLKLMQERDNTYDLEERIAEKIKQYASQDVDLAKQREGESEEAFKQRQREAAIEELQAEAIMTLMDDMMGMQAMQEAHPTILKKIVDGIKRWLRKLKTAIAEIGRRNPEVAAMLQARGNELQTRAQRYMDLMQRIGQNQVLDASQQSRAYSLSQETGEQLQELGLEAPEQVLYSLAGEHAQGRYGDAVRQARQMEYQGASDEEIIKATGAVRGFRGRWWAPIDNWNMTVNPDIKLTNRIRRAVWNGGEVTMSLGELYEAEELYEAYPALRDAQLQIHPVEEGAAGRLTWQKGQPLIEISTGFLNDMDNQGENIWSVMEETLQHEIQHIIQGYEGSHRGSDVFSWQRIKDAYEQRMQVVSAKMQELEDKYGADFLWNIPLTSAYNVDEDAMSPEQQDAVYDRMSYEDIWWLQEGRRFMDKYDQIAGRDATQLYRDTVGEREARATEERGGPQRANYRDAVALEDYMDRETGAVRYSLGTETEQMAREAAQLTNDRGEQMLQVLEGGSVARYSYTSWITDNDREKVRKYLKKQGFEDEQINAWIADLDSIAAIIGMDRTRLDYRADRKKSAKKKNADIYKWTIDFSTLCKKRLVYQGTRDMIQSLLPNTGLTANDLIMLNNMMQEMGYQAPCSFCYVEGQRKDGGEFAEDFVRRYRQNHPDAKYFPNVWDVTSAAGLWKLQTEHPEVYRSFISANNRRGVASTKPIQLRTDYRAEIRRMTKDTITYLNNHGGLRMQSFSDFETLHLLDMMQVVLDMTARGLKSQAYTKVADFAWVFGMTGIKINLSLVGEGTGLDANGNLIFSSTEGMDIEEAMRLRDAYSYNVGTILVGMNRAHILAAMADPRIDFIIPFHSSNWTKEDMKLMVGLRNYDDFQAWQNEAHIERDAEGNIKRGNNTERNLDPTEYWRFELSGKENAERYLDKCAELGIVPKFEIFLDYDAEKGRYFLKKDGTTDGYWKLLIDYKMYDNSGRGARQQVVTPNFNMEEAQRILDEYDGLGNGTLPVAYKVVKRYLREYAAMHPENQEVQAALARANEMDETEGQTRFSMSAPVEYTRDLVAIHNLDERGLLEDLRMGGFPSPSIAVVNRRKGFRDYGDISVIFDRYTVDPYINGSAHIYGGDAYTPTMGGFRAYSADNALEHLREQPARDFGNIVSPRQALQDYQEFRTLGQAKQARWRNAAITNYDPDTATYEETDKRNNEITARHNRYNAAERTWRSIVHREVGKTITPIVEQNAGNEALTRLQDYLNQYQDIGIDPNAVIRVFNNFFAQVQRSFGVSDPGQLEETEENIRSLNELLEAAKDTYFNGMQEAKPDETIGFEHVKMVLLPADVSRDVVNALENAGIPYRKYSGWYRIASRLEELNKFVDEYEAERQNAGVNEEDEDSWESQVLFSLDGVEDTDPAMGQLLQENEQFRTLTAQLAAELNRQEMRNNAHLTSKANLTRIARYLRDNWKVRLPIGTMSENLGKIFTALTQAKTAAEAQAAMQALGDFARDALYNAEVTDSTDADLYQEVRSWIRMVHTSPEVIRDVYGDMASYRRSGFGTIRMNRAGETSNVDQIYSEMLATLGNVMREDLVNDADQLAEMLRVLDSLAPRVYNPYEEGEMAAHGSVLEVASRDLAMKLLQNFAEGGRDSQVLDGLTEPRMDRLAQLLDRAEVVVQDSNQTLTVAGYQGMTNREHTRTIERMREQIRQADSNVEAARQEISRMHQQLIDSREELKRKERTVEDLRNQLRNAQGRMSQQEKQELEQKVRDAEAQVKAAQRRIKALEQRLQDQGTRLRQRVRDAVRREHDRMAGISQAERDRRNARDLRNKTEREILRRKASLLKKLNSPNRNGWIPLEMEEAVIELLKAVDTEGDISGTPNTPLSAALLQRAKAAYESINKNDPNGNPGPMAAYYNGDLSMTFDELSQSADGKQARDLTQHELELLRDIVAGYAAAVINEDRMFTQQQSESLRDMGEEMIQQAKDRIQTRGEERVRGPLANWMSQATDRGLLKPVTVFERFNGTVLGDIWRNALRPAEWKHIRHVQEAEEFLREALERFHQQESVNRDGSRRQERQAFTLSSGRTIRLTDQELMTIYATQKREALTGTNHLLGGGITLANKQRGDTNEEYRLTEEDLQKFADALSQEQKDYVDHMVHYLSTTVGEWGNVVTRELYGIEKFRETYYIPVRVNRSYIQQLPSTEQDARLKVASHTKTLTKNASNTIEIQGFTQLWCSHVEQMSDYNAFVLPMEDMTRLMNYKVGAYDDQGNFIGQGDNVRPLMERAWGTNTVGYIHDFLSRLNGNSRNERGGSWLNAMMGKAKGAAVTWNLSVAFQQAGAGVRAMAEMDPRDVLPALITGIGRNGGFHRNYEELQRYAPIAVEKSWGYFDTNMSRGLYQRAQTTWRSRLDDAGGWLAGMGDELNWSQIWDACQHEVRRLNPGMTEEEVKRHAGQRVVEVIDRTQVVDSIFQRSAFATEKGMMRGLMSFMSEPVTMYNMVVRTVDQYRDAFRTRDATARRAARAKAIRTGCSIILSAALTAFLKSLVTGLRDRDPEKKDKDGNIIGSRSYLDKVADAWLPNLGDNLMGLFTIFGNMYDNATGNFGNSDLTTAWISNLYDAGKEILKGEDADWDKVAYRATQAVSNLSGIGFAGLYRDTKAIFMTVKETMDPESLTGTAWDKSQPWDVRMRAAERNYAYTKDHKTGSMKLKPTYYTDWLLEEYTAHGFSEDYQLIADTAIRMGATESGLKSSFTTKLRTSEPLVQQAAQALADGDMDTYNQAMQKLQEGGIGKKTANSMVNTAYNALVKTDEETEPKDPGTGAGLVDSLRAEGSTTTAPAKNAGDDLLTDKATPDDVRQAVQLYKAAGMTEEKITDKVSGKYKKPYILATISGDTEESRRCGENLKAGGITQAQMKEWTTEGVFSSTKDYGLYWMIKEGRTEDAKKAVQHLNKTYPGGQKAVKERVLKWAKGLKPGSYDYATVKRVLLAIGISESTINSTLKK